MSSHTALPIEPLDVLIIGAGVSGIGAAAYLRRHQPHKVFAILESRERMGGTWDLFRYPGIRSDSDLYTFGFDFKPWTKAKSLADAADILEYLREAVAEYQLDPFIQYRQKVVSANWQSDKGLWAVCVEDGHTAETRTIECRWLFSAGGYYRYDQGFSPRFEGAEQFKGQIIHPQHWPERLDYRGKHVVVIGSGATAVTLIPAMADEVASITMLQRTPSYIVNQPANDSVAAFLRKILPAQTAYSLTRYKNAKITLVFWRFCQRFPGLARKLLIWLTRRELPKGYPVDVHFNPPYKPWDQRLCSVPEGDLFKAISAGKASVVTDHIERFTESGVLLKSGTELKADIIITATGLNVQLFGGIALHKDGEPVVLSQTLAYKGTMLSGVPNFAFAVGYTNSSWTLKVCLLCDHFCRLLGFMDSQGHNVCEPKAPDGVETRPLLDFGAGYVQRALDSMPRQGPREPWVMSMDYFIVGLGLQLIYWPEALIAGLVERGLRVITLDNRDSGRSFFTEVTPPTTLQQFFRKPTAGYDLGDMADDVIGLMDGLRLGAAHVVGMSMGGMIAQTLAARYPQRVMSLASIFSTTGSLRVGQPAFKTILQLLRRPPRNQRESVRDYVEIMRSVGTTLEWDEQAHRDYAMQAWERGGGEASNLGMARQIGAIINSGDRTQELQRIRCNTLVIHAEKDLMVATSGGFATAAAIPRARLVLLPGMGHDFPACLTGTLLSLLAGQMH